MRLLDRLRLPLLPSFIAEFLEEFGGGAALVLAAKVRLRGGSSEDRLAVLIRTTAQGMISAKSWY